MWSASDNILHAGVAAVWNIYWVSIKKISSIDDYLANAFLFKPGIFHLIQERNGWNWIIIFLGLFLGFELLIKSIFFEITIIQSITIRRSYKIQYILRGGGIRYPITDIGYNRVDQSVYV